MGSFEGAIYVLEVLGYSVLTTISRNFLHKNRFIPTGKKKQGKLLFKECD